MAENPVNNVVLQHSILISLGLQQNAIVLKYFLERRRLLNMFIAVSLRKRSYFLNKLLQKVEKRAARMPRSIWVKPGSTDTFWLNLINGIATEEKWKLNFRMPRETLAKLCENLSPFISNGQNSPNYRAVNLEKKVACCLYYLKDTGSIWMTANTFGLHQSTVSKIIIEVCTAITYHLGPKLIYLPKNEQEMKEKIAKTEMKFGMPQAFGFIDGTHIPIKRPSNSSQDYFNYKGFHSVSVQAVCDYRGMFLDVDCRWPGSLHDAKVFSNSSINKRMVENTLPVTYQKLLPGHCEVPSHIIGDPAYPLTPYCLKEYLHCHQNKEVIFNNMLRSARNQIECAFGRLKARWSILTRKIDLKLENVPVVIYACFVLHNFCELEKVSVDEEQVKKHIMEIHNNDILSPDPLYSCNTDEGLLIREVITQYIGHCLPDHL